MGRPKKKEPQTELEKLQSEKLRLRAENAFKGTVGKIAPNILNRDFKTDCPCSKLATDVTQISIGQQKSFLSPIIDMFNGEILSYNVSDRADLEQINKMLKDVFVITDKLPKQNEIMLHSDQGWQYQHKDYQNALADPFILDNRGHIHPLIANNDSLQTLHLDRKYPNNSSIYELSKLQNSTFECANSKSFNHPVTVHTITQIPNFNYENIPIDTTLKKQYWRFVSKDASAIAEIEFIDRNGILLKGEIIGEDPVSSNPVFDNNPLTFKTVNSFIGMDFGKPVSLSKIRYLPKNDANGIYPGNKYELYYYSKTDGWVSLGVKIATDNGLNYDNVPTGRLYWLRNHTTGKEERIFTWENGKVRFW